MTEPDDLDDDDLNDSLWQDSDEFDADYAERDWEPDPREWWQNDTADWIDLERQRCAAILAACIRCHRPTLALKWIAAGTSIDDVMLELLGILSGKTPSRPAAEEFDDDPIVFSSLDVSRAAYVTERLFEKARAKRCGW